MSEWVLLLGGSTGHAAATAKRLAQDGFGIIAFHFDRGDAKKIAEEANELAISAVSNDGRILDEAADLMYHLQVLLIANNLTLNDLQKELSKRNK